MQYDIAVVGGGTGGVPAAVEAARSGAKVLLVERYGFLGGMATAGLVNPYMGYWAGGKPIVRGIFEETLAGLRNGGGLAENGQTFDEEVLKVVLDRMVLEAGVATLFHAAFVSCECACGRIESARFVSKEGCFDVTAEVFIDATGDADLAAAAGASVEIGRSEDGLCQPMTLSFRLAGIDLAALPSDFGKLRKILNDAYLAAKADGSIDNPREDILIFKTLREDVLHFNTTRVVGKSPVSTAQLSEAEFEGRRQAFELLRLFKERVAGFEDAYIQKSGVLIGVRESRRVMGEYVLQVEDILSARKFDDAVACSSYPVDIHNPAGTGTVIRRLPPGQWYEIPYRSIVPLGLDNLLMAARSISATHEAHSSLRVMPVVAAIGQAAGAAAAMAASERRAARDVDADQLRNRLVAAGAFVGESR